MLFGEVIGFCTDIHTKHNNTLWFNAYNFEFLSLSSARSYKRVFEGSSLSATNIQTYRIAISNVWMPQFFCSTIIKATSKHTVT